jgi:hypothetical protein
MAYKGHLPTLKTFSIQHMYQELVYVFLICTVLSAAHDCHLDIAISKMCPNRNYCILAASFILLLGLFTSELWLALVQLLNEEESTGRNAEMNAVFLQTF